MKNKIKEIEMMYHVHGFYSNNVIESVLLYKAPRRLDQESSMIKYLPSECGNALSEILECPFWLNTHLLDSVNT